MQLILLPLAGKDETEKQNWVRHVIYLAKEMKDEREQKFILAGLLVVSDKFIKKADAEEIRREISMTKVGRMLFEDGQREGRKEGRKEERMIAIVNLLSFNVPEKKILEKNSEEDLIEAKETIKAVQE